MLLLSILIAKDFRRTWRNPWPWLINLVIPLAMTALVGSIFGGKSDAGPLQQIRVAVVNEDKSFVSDLLITAAGRWKDGRFLNLLPMAREDAVKSLSANKLSAVVILPVRFSQDYLIGQRQVTLELLKNPAEVISPAVLEELLNVLTAMMNVVSRNLQPELSKINSVFNGHGLPSFETGQAKLTKLADYLNPTAVTVDFTSGNTTTSPNQAKSSFNLFAFLLAGMLAMFLLFMANIAMSDLHREIGQRTFSRFQTLRHSAATFITAKVLFTVFALLICCALTFGIGSLAFNIDWKNPGGMALLTVGYTFFVASFVALIVSLSPDAARSSVFGVVAAMVLGMLGGSTIPPENMPPFLRDVVAPLLPSNWYVTALRGLQAERADVALGLVFMKLVIVSAIIVLAASFLLNRKLKANA